MLANQLIDRLERLGLLDQEIIEALREQLAQGGSRVTPEAIAKLLVDNGQLTRYQATKLIGDLRSDEYEEDQPAVAAAESDELGLLDEGDDRTTPAEATSVGSAEIEPVEAEPVAAVGVAEPEEVEAIPVAADPVDFGGDSGGLPPTDRPRRSRPKPPENKSVWDSFKIYGYLGIIVVFLLAGGGLWFMISRGNADDRIAHANELYEKEQYQSAQEQYLRFLDDFGQEHQYSSLARTRVALAELYRAEGLSDPTRGLEVAQERLPEIGEEEHLNQERANLAALLVDIADRIAAKAVDVEQTAEKQRLLDKLDEQIELTENPLYMTGQLRSQLSTRLLSVAEARARVQRDINRNLRLDESVAAMEAALEDRQTKRAYDIRFELLRDFPELHDHPRLDELVVEASEIQQRLVEPSAQLPERIDTPPERDALRSIMLTTLEGRTVPGVQGETMFLRAGGSVLAFAAEDGRLMWRKFTGYGQDYAPIRLDNGAAVLLCDADNLEVQHCRGSDGEVRWRSVIGEPFSEPEVEGDDVYVSAEGGRLVALDGQSGDAKWVTQIPQALEVGPGIDDRADRAYLPGDHSNLYVLNTRDGSCVESFYLGHAAGTIAVPPIPLLGHLFVIENAAPDYARVHVLRVNEKGEALRVAQPDFRLTGNVTVAPVVMGRRLIVLTDRGQVVVYDVEPTAEGKQVTSVAELVASYNRPTPTQMAVGRNQMWVTGSRIGRYELQINTGRIVADWGKYAGDTFIGEPLALEDAVLSARVLRESSAIRVTAIEPKTGQELWRTDVGVPVAMITPIPDKKGFHAVTTQGALFELDSESFTSGSTKAPLENPGDKGIAMRFEDPIPIDDTRRLFLNQATPGEILVYDPSRDREKLRKLQLLLPGGKPTGRGLVAGGGLFLPLDSGRAVLMNWQTGGVLGSPFQPASDPTGSVQWTTPIPLPDDPNQVVIADSRKKLYRLRVADQIRELSQVDLEGRLLGPAARLGETMIATTPGPAGDFVLGYDLASLQPRFQTLLDSRVTWGPVAGGEAVWLRTDDGVLRGFADDGTERFGVELPAGEIVAPPVESDGKLIFAGRQGWLVAVDAASGEVLSEFDLGQPISAAPLPVPGNRLLVPGGEGLIYFAEL